MFTISLQNISKKVHNISIYLYIETRTQGKAHNQRKEVLIMNVTPTTDYITSEQLINMKVGDEIIFTTVENTKFRIRKTNESEKCFAWYCITTKCSICARCKADYILNAKVY